MKKNRLVLMALLLLASRLAQADSQWVLEQSTLTYHVSHPLHQSEGVSKAARGKGVCQAGQCDFLIAVPVKSFDSGDSNRDLHMLQATRGAQFPMVIVRTRLPETASGSATIHADLESVLPNATQANNAEELVRVIRQQFKEGADFIKIYETGHDEIRNGELRTPAQYTEAELEAAIREAARVGKRIAVHATGEPGTLYAARAA